MPTPSPVPPLLPTPSLFLTSLGGRRQVPCPPPAPGVTPATGWLVLNPPRPIPHGHRFSPEVLGLCASTALVWIVLEVLALLLGVYLATVHADLSTFHLLAYSGYKYVG